ncbi:MAG: FecR family protein [Desulfomicrobium sp.]|nr:FecR family protein [Desulfomicrobium sp.]
MRFFTLLLLSLVVYAGTAQAETQVAGFIKTVEGSGQIVRAEAVMPARIGDVLHVSDTVMTEEKSSIGIMLEDDTILSLGPNSHLELGDFAFAPQEENYAVAIRLLKGSFAYMSGVIARLAPDKVRIETPDAVIAVHGTSFLVKVEE